ncbi:MAG TPA: hypothetical protein VMX17_07960 [Candidatus Glassbacteria bacterium]|nr:hypothetical protein [Candidatus Glassbacteria bacterium]
MRKLLISPGYGAGWTSWSGGSREQIKFMLEYKSFVDYIEKYNKDNEGHYGGVCVPDNLRKEFEMDWKEKFPEASVPYMGGLDKLEVVNVHDDNLIRIKEYDGFESVVIAGDDEWY